MSNIFKESRKLKKTLKIFDIFLLFFVISVIFLFFAINFSKKDFKSSYYDISVARAEKLSIKTDKKEYQKGEEIKIYLDNFSTKDLKEDDSSLFTVSSLRYLGENYGVGLIEKRINSSWIAIEPVWRCENKCYEQCEYQDIIASKEQKIFNWDQNLLYCNVSDKTEEKEASSEGTYRVSLASWDERAKDYSVLHSEEFTIISN